MSDLGLEPVAEPRARKRFRWAPGCIAVLLALALLGGGAAFVVVQGGGCLSRILSSAPEDYVGDGFGAVVVQVRSGDTATKIGERLAKAGVVKTSEAFSDAARNDDRSREIQVGFYRLRREMSAVAALAMLLDPDSRAGTTVTLPEGLRLSEIVSVLAQNTRFTPREITAALEDSRALPLPPYARGEPEGYLFPATYEISPKQPVRDVLAAMVERFSQAAADVDLVAGARQLGITPGQAVTIASLVQAEASRTQDMAKVARVIYNRLRIDEPLGLDSTVHYAVESSGDIFTTRKERGVNSPYNTYNRVGLPPGPIDSPGEDALRAALDPAKGDWIYFVTVNLDTGKTKFATTAAQHEANRGLLADWCTSHSGRC